jgi:hypothetical protein
MNTISLFASIALASVSLVTANEGYLCPYTDLGATIDNYLLLDNYTTATSSQFRDNQTEWLSLDTYCQALASQWDCEDTYQMCFWDTDLSNCNANFQRLPDCLEVCQAVLNGGAPNCLGSCEGVTIDNTLRATLCNDTRPRHLDGLSSPLPSVTSITSTTTEFIPISTTADFSSSTQNPVLSTIDPTTIPSVTQDTNYQNFTVTCNQTTTATSTTWSSTTTQEPTSTSTTSWLSSTTAEPVVITTTVTETVTDSSCIPTGSVSSVGGIVASSLNNTIVGNDTVTHPCNSRCAFRMDICIERCY